MLETTVGFRDVELSIGVTFLGAACSGLKPDKWHKILASQVVGQFTNVYTKRDLLLLLYTVSEHDWAAGRNRQLEKCSQDGGRNFSQDTGKEPVVSREPYSFRLKNFDLMSLVCTQDYFSTGHTDYLTQLEVVMSYIHSRN